MFGCEKLMRNRVRAVLAFLAGFEAAARTASFTQAAAELNLTQSAVSRQIKALESALGVTLFERFNRRLVLTGAGRALHATVTVMLRELDAGLARLAPSPSTNLVSVSTSVPFASLWLVPRLAAFRALHPEVDVRISADNAMVDLAARGFDLAVRFAHPDIAPAGAIALHGEEVFPVCAPSLVGRGRKPLRAPQDLAHHVLLQLDDAGAVPWLDWSQWFAANGVTDPPPARRVRLSHYDQLIRAAVDGDGVALGRSPLVDAFLANGSLVAPFRGRAAVPRKYYLVLRPDRAPTEAVAAFVAWITGAANAGEQRDRVVRGARKSGKAADRTRQ